MTLGRDPNLGRVRAHHWWVESTTTAGSPHPVVTRIRQVRYFGGGLHSFLLSSLGNGSKLKGHPGQCWGSLWDTRNGAQISCM